MAQNHFRHNQLHVYHSVTYYAFVQLLACGFSCFCHGKLIHTHFPVYACLRSDESQIGDAESGADIKYTWTLLVCQVSTGWRTAKTEKTHQTR